MDTAQRLIDHTRALSASLAPLTFGPPVACVYDPLVYAWAPHEQYLRRFGDRTGRVVLVGMNPGPWGMAQTGVPFGEIEAVRGWMGIEAPVGRPSPEHPKRPILGFGCDRSEVSGRRLWGWARDAYGGPDQFFDRFFVLNWCPLVFMEESGRNLTPDKLTADERERLFPLCDRALRANVEALAPSWVVGVGGFAAERARAALAGLDVRIGQVLHPSPASPSANRGWQEAAIRELAKQGIPL